MSDLLPIGTRIRFNRQIVQGATEDTPPFLFAEKGEMGRISGYQPHPTRAQQWPYSVNCDGCDGSFACSADEFEVAPCAEHVKSAIHDDLCATRRGYPCNCPSAAFYRKQEKL